MNTDVFEVWRQDESTLAGLGAALFSQRLTVTVRLPGDLARSAVAAWERDDEGILADETPSQAQTRKRAGALALVGLAVQQSGVWAGDQVEVEVDAWQIGSALDSAEDHGLLIDAPPTTQ